MKLRKRLVTIVMAGVMAVSMLGAGVSARQITSTIQNYTQSGWTGVLRRASWNDDTSTRVGQRATTETFLERNHSNVNSANRRIFTSMINLNPNTAITRTTIDRTIVRRDTGATVVPRQRINGAASHGESIILQQSTRLAAFVTVETVWTTTTFTIQDIAGNLSV